MWHQGIIAIVVNIGGLIDGFCATWPSPVYFPLTDIGSKELCHGPFTDEQFTWAVSMMFISACIWSPLAAIGVHKFGRRTTLFVSAGFWLTTWFLTATASHIVHIFVARAFAGIACATVYVANPMYVAEIADPKWRGALCSTMQVEFFLGNLLMHVMGSQLSLPNIAWTCLAVVAVWTVGLCLIPESPVYLMEVNRRDEALEVLVYLRRDRTEAEAEVNKLQVHVATKPPPWNMTLGELCSCDRSPASRGLMIACCLVIIQKCSGNVIMAMNAKNIFEAAGGSISSDLSTILVGVVQVTSSMFCPLLVDRAGRRLLLLLSMGGMTLSLVALGGYMYALETAGSTSAAENVQYYGFICQTSFMIYVMMFCLACSPLPSLVMAELFDAERRPLACAITVAIGWMSSFILSIGWYYVKTIFGLYAVFFTFSFACIVGWVFTLLFLPETKGRTFEQITNILKSPQMIFIRSTPTGDEQS